MRVVVSFDIVDELFMLLSVALVPVDGDDEVPVVAEPLFVPVERVVLPLFIEPLFVEPLLFIEPLVVPVERVVLPLFIEPLFVEPLLFIEPLVVPVEPVVPAFGPEPWLLLLGEPEAPPWPPPDEPVCASAPPQAIAAAAERARILRVCLMGYS